MSTSTTREGPSVSSEILDDVVEEGRRVLAAARASGVPLRLLGGVAVRLHSAALPREYKDLDFVTARRASSDAQQLLRELGYEPHAEFNAMNGRERLLFFDVPHERQVDVFVGAFRMCHEIPLEERLDAEPDTVPLPELLLTKLQIVELNEKDVSDAVALLAERDVDAERVAELCAQDWGLWRTITRNLDAVAARLDDYDVDRDRVRGRLDELQARIEAAEKSHRWRLRARIGERKRWYELPEEV